MIIQTKPIYLILTAFTIVFNEINCDDKLSKQTKQIKLVSASKTKVWGPGLTPDKVVLPVRYFFIQVVDEQGREYVSSLNLQLNNRIMELILFFYILLVFVCR